MSLRIDCKTSIENVFVSLGTLQCGYPRVDAVVRGMFKTNHSLLITTWTITMKNKERSWFT